ncbi:DUF6879 family protein [Planotetraspora sp. GP83]|uniref:DUF6879 family protein n=1 Tax=Planotetraspora sp. GP83 TaxID=3156264 RepID=UPI003517987B
MRADVFDHVWRAEGTVLPLADYQAEFDEVYGGAEEEVWKLERAQHFHESDVASWRAAAEGDWPRSLALIEEMRGPLTEMYRGLPRFLRLRVVELPLTPYLQWEAHVFAIRVSAGEAIRVLPASAVARLEQMTTLPELVIFGPDLMYQVCYDEVGAASGARRITDARVVTPCRAAVISLYGEAEDLLPFFDREVAPLRPPEHLLPGRTGFGS